MANGRPAPRMKNPTTFQLSHTRLASKTFLTSPIRTTQIRTLLSRFAKNSEQAPTKFSFWLYVRAYIAFHSQSQFRVTKSRLTSFLLRLPQSMNPRFWNRSRLYFNFRKLTIFVMRFDAMQGITGHDRRRIKNNIGNKVPHLR